MVDPLEVLSHPCRSYAVQEGFELVEHADGTQDAWGAARSHAVTGQSRCAELISFAVPRSSGFRFRCWCQFQFREATFE